MLKGFRIIFLIFISILTVFVFLNFKAPKTNLFSSFSIKNNKDFELIEKLSNLSNNRINFIVESSSKDETLNLSYEIENYLNTQKQSDTILQVLNVYKEYPANFISKDTERLLKEKKFSELEKKSLKIIYAPLGFFASPLEKDPFALSGLFLEDNIKISNREIIQKENKFYSLISSEIDKTNVKATIDFVDELNESDNSHIYLSGSLIHSYLTSENSKKEINIICILSCFFVAVLSLLYLKSIKILLPVSFAIGFGFYFGFLVSSIVFKELNVLTFVFSTSLIGIGFDYVLHFYLSSKDKNFNKSLLISYLSTSLAFLILYFSNIQILKEISIFVIFGLLGVYIFTYLYLPLFKIESLNKTLKPYNLQKLKPLILIFVFAVIFFGAFKFDLNNDIKNLYKPKGELLKAEEIYSKVFKSNPLNFILVKGENLDEILQKEEKIEDELCRKNVQSVSLSRFVSSSKKQKENQKLVHNLYQERLEKYADFLDKATIKNLKKENIKIYDVEKFPLKDKFMLDNKTSFIALLSEYEGNNLINVTKKMNEAMENVSKKCIKIIPVIFLLLYLLLSFFHSQKQVVKIILPSLISTIFTLCFLSLIGQTINIFHILACILVVGFSLDYSIFKQNLSEESNLAVFVSCFSTVISFSLLSLTNFKLVSCLCLTLCVGIFTSYILSLVFVKKY